MLGGDEPASGGARPVAPVPGRGSGPGGGHGIDRGGLGARPELGRGVVVVGRLKRRRSSSGALVKGSHWVLLVRHLLLRRVPAHAHSLALTAKRVVLVGLVDLCEEKKVRGEQGVSA